MEFIIDAAVKEAYEAKGIKDEDIDSIWIRLHSRANAAKVQ
jgi:hypothetical protein